MNIIEAGLDLASFNATDVDSEYALIQKETGYFFRLLTGQGISNAFDCRYGPSKKNRSIPTLSGYLQARDWQIAFSRFREWIQWVKEELSVPDLLAEVTKTAQLFAPTTEPSDDKFTRTELAEVQGQLRLLQLSFTHAALPEAAKQKLIELTETAAGKAEGLTKKDWQNWIIGGFISAITGLALNPTQAGEVLKLVKAAFGGLFLH